MALTVEDVLARRLRLQFLDSAAAKEVEEGGEGDFEKEY
jgi:glycerol-3-phosphate dehydrogenase